MRKKEKIDEDRTVKKNSYLFFERLCSKCRSICFKSFIFAIIAVIKNAKGKDAGVPLANKFADWVCGIARPKAVKVVQPQVQPQAQAPAQGFCTSCGAPLTGGAFCNNCGNFHGMLLMIQVMDRVFSNVP